MNRFQKIAYPIACVLLFIGTLFQGVAMYALSPYFFLREHYTPAIDMSELPWLQPVWMAALILVPVVTVLVPLLRQKEKTSLVLTIIAVVAGVASLIVGLTFKNALPVTVGLKYDQGIDTFQFIYCYLTTVVAAGLVAIVAAVNYYNLREDRIRMENEQYVDQYEHEDSHRPEIQEEHRPKKSLRAAQRKKEK